VSGICDKPATDRQLSFYYFVLAKISLALFYVFFIGGLSLLTHNPLFSSLSIKAVDKS
jgi:hypothetical protein